MDLFIMLFVNVLLKSSLILCHRLDLSGFSFGLEVTRIETLFFFAPFLSFHLMLQKPEICSPFHEIVFLFLIPL